MFARDLKYTLKDRKSDRVQILDVMKGICILMIILTHYSWNDKQRLFGLFPFWVDMAVPVFMIISGYVYACSFIKNKVEKFENAYELFFIAKKVIDIPFLLALCLLLNILGTL